MIGTDEDYMALALEVARKAAQAGEIPVGAVVVDPDGVVLTAAANAPITTHDPTAHAEIVALRRACAALGNYRLPPGLSLYVTLEPCAMCAGAISQARVSRLVFGASDPKGGAIAHGPRYFSQPTCHWRPEVTAGVAADAAGDLLRAFFRARRA
jgi:tRNA(Arg) A34 adenosine deaminase TadA